MEIRLAREDETELVVGLFDARVKWLAANGRSGQWGERPFSQIDWFVERLRGWIAAGETWLAMDGAGAAGTVTLAEPPDYAMPATEPEVYVHALATRTRSPARGVGGILLEHAGQIAADRGARLIRVDCWAGGDGALVDYYKQRGFELEGPVVVGEWEGVILRRRLSGSGR